MAGRNNPNTAAQPPAVQYNGASITPTFRDILNDPRFRNRVRTSAGEQSNVFLASMLDLYESDSDLQRCSPQRVATECLKAASLHLPIVKSLGFAYVVPFKETPTFIIGYKGLVQLALRSGQFRYLNTGAVYEGECIRTNRITGQLEISGERTGDKTLGYFAYFQLVNGFEKSVYMTTEEVREHGKKYSKAYHKGPWQDNFDAMAQKTVLRKILKFAPMSTEMAEAERAEIYAAQVAAQAEVNRNANQGPLLDVPQMEESGAAEEERADTEETLTQAAHVENDGTPWTEAPPQSASDSVQAAPVNPPTSDAANAGNGGIPAQAESENPDF